MGKCWKGAPLWKSNISWNARVKGHPVGARGFAHPEPIGVTPLLILKWRAKSSPPTLHVRPFCQLYISTLKFWWFGPWASVFEFSLARYGLSPNIIEYTHLKVGLHPYQNWTCSVHYLNKNDQHFLEKWCSHTEAKCLRNSKMALKF